MIKVVQLDPNGLCNAKCWYCPVAYGGNPQIGKKNMEIDVLTNILGQLDAGRGDFVDPNFKKIYSAHYNEILLYPYFKEMIFAYRKYNLVTQIFTNGTTLNKERIDFIKENKDVIKHITLNIPSAFPEEWSDYVGLNIKMFDKMMDNLQYLQDQSVIKNKEITVTLQVNGVQDESLFKNGGHITMLKNSPKINTDPHIGNTAKTINKFKTMFPKFYIFADIHLNDRSGKLDENNVMTNIETINLEIKNSNKKVIGCSGGDGNSLSRSEEWLHINANGDIILCCHDYDFKTSYINIKDNTIKEIWNGQKRKEMIKESYNNFCTKCKYAIWK